MNPLSVGIVRARCGPRASAIFLVSASILGNGLMAFCGQSVGESPDKSGKATEALLLVRQWNPETGTLVGWLPMHQTVIELEALDRSPGLHFNPNDAIQVRWPVRPKQVPKVGGIEVTPKVKTIDGTTWVLAKREPNLVRIGKRYYLVRMITFVENEEGAAPRSSQALGFGGVRQ